MNVPALLEAALSFPSTLHSYLAPSPALLPSHRPPHLEGMVASPEEEEEVEEVSAKNQEVSSRTKKKMQVIGLTM